MNYLIDENIIEVLRHDQLSDDWLDKIAELYSRDDDDQYLEHYGKGHDDNPPGPGSGRYPYGSGERANQRAWDVRSRVKKLKDQGLSESQIAASLGYYRYDAKGNIMRGPDGEPLGNTSKLRAERQIAKNITRNEMRQRILELDEMIDPETGEHYSNVKIAKIISKEFGEHKNESSVRNLRNEESAERAERTNDAVKTLKEAVGKDNFIDVGSGTEKYLGISKDRLNVALEMLKDEGYQVGTQYIQQVNSQFGTRTTRLVLLPPGADPEELNTSDGLMKVKLVNDPDGPSTDTLRTKDIRPVLVDLDRVKVKYEEEGGKLKDGLIELRAYVDKDGNVQPACPDLSLGNAKYAQVRIAVDGDKDLGLRYIKGMAVYNTDLPKGTDILVNSNKSQHEGLKEALKEFKKDKRTNEIKWDNPFGASFYQTEYVDAQGNKKKSAINIVGDIWGSDQHKEGAWSSWSRNLPSQFLGKQSETLIKKQLDLKTAQKKAEFEEIMNLTNPTVKRQMLIDFADGCDKAAVDLKAAPLAHQGVHVILPLTTIKSNEIYAPNYENGTIVACIRYPHAGPFELPILKVNNNNKEALKFMKNAKDAVGINPKTAALLSGADFDGDTVTVIPMTRKNSSGEMERLVNIKGLGNGASVLPGFENFDHQKLYKGTDDNGDMLPGVKRMTASQKGREMGVVSNLINDMTLKGCEDPEELARAVKYSMVVIDAEKHKLNFKQACKDYNIQELKEKYQSKPDQPGKYGASTILSRAKSQRDVVKRQIWSPSPQSIDPKTGEKIYKEARDAHFIDYKTGEVKDRHQKSTWMAEEKDARNLMSSRTNPNPKELLYANFANTMKAMGNNARKEYLDVPHQKVNAEAKKEYAAEVASLNYKLDVALKNAPRERQAQAIASAKVNALRYSDEEYSNEELKKYGAQQLNAARNVTGAGKTRVTFTPREWEAVTAGAISETTLQMLLKNADTDSYKQLATPKTSRYSASTINSIQSLLKAGWTRNEIVEAGIYSMNAVQAAEAKM